MKFIHIHFFNHNHNPNTTPIPKPNPKPNPNPNPNYKPNPNPNAYPNPNPTSSYTFKTRCLSFKVKLLQRKGRLFSFLTILVHISNNVSFQRNTCAFHKNEFHEIHTLSKAHYYDSK